MAVMVLEPVSAVGVEVLAARALCTAQTRTADSLGH